MVDVPLKNRSTACRQNLLREIAPIALSLVQLSGLILCGRVGKHTDDLPEELVSSAESKTDCTEWNTDGWESYKRALGVMVDHYVSKALTQRLERTNGIQRQQTLSLASTTKQVWQGMGADKSHPTFSHQLLQPDLGAFVLGNYSGEREQS